ncbi:MAG: ATP-binding protein [Duganella sp.]
MLNLAQYQALFRASPLPYLVLTPEFVIAAASDEYLRLTGLTLEQLAGRPLFEALPENLQRADAGSADEVRASLLRALSMGHDDSTAVLRYALPAAGRWDDHYWRIVHTPVLDGDGRVVLLLQTLVDVTERCRAERELREAGHQRDEFLAMLAHELRNPLAPVSTAAELLKMTAAHDTRTLKATEVILRQVKHMTTLIDDLLDVSRVTRALVRLDALTVDMKIAVTCAVEQVRPLIELCHHTLTLDMPVEPVLVIGDPTRLAQAIANLLNNAARYTPHGGHIVLRLRSNAATVSLSVSDDGQGIEPQLLPQIFDLFTQARRTPDRTQGGLGIGLALVKSLIEQHGGNIRADSPGAGQGSCFTICLPLAGAGQANAPPASDSPVPAAAPLAPALEIMVVDDNVDAAEALADLLTLEGHHVSVQTHPLQAIAAATISPPQVFVLDIGLPEIDGYELARRLRSHPSTRHALLIALTGYGQSNDRQQSEAAGFAHHFVKPLDPQKLRRILANAQH